MNESTDTLELFESILIKYRVINTLQKINTLGWTHLWESFQKTYDTAEFANDSEKYIYVDLFFSQCLKYLPTEGSVQILAQIANKWLTSRKLDARCGWLQHNEKIALVHFCVKLREKLCEILTSVPPEAFDVLTPVDHRIIITLWRQLFFEPFSALALFWNPPQPEQDQLIAKFKTSGYGGLVAASMYQPFNADDYNIDCQVLVSSSIPYCLKVIIFFWMVNIPYFHGTEKHRQRLTKYVPELCRSLVQNPSIVSTYFFFTFIQEVMTGFWRASYIGGNNVAGLSAFGDFISLVMQHSFPFPKPEPKPDKLANGEKIRVGYISRNFFKQAVSCYMVNRVVFHDRDKFELHIFALGDYHDHVSDMFKNNSASFQRFTDLANLKATAEAIRSKELDILIYADIGMDPVTYMLSGLQLAPVQCALVGHGTSTGMPTIQYYLSGDFEGPNAQEHYREKLVRLPVLGAAQYLPMKPERHLTRESLGIPDDAVIFISCANGLKHGLARNHLLVNILKKAPNAYILLKPYAHYASIDYKFAEEIVEAAREAGVGDRLIILPPIADPKHVLGLLAIADVQLDTYPYGGWTTNMEALYMGLPIVTQQGELARSRWGAGMLRALGINEGIAVDEEDYVAWAVKLAEDRDLIERLKGKIRKKVRKILFNGTAAQPTYEKVLLDIYDESCRQIPEQLPSTPEAPAVILTQQSPVIVTSFAPGNYANQRLAMQGWQDAGFQVVSINALDEIAVIREYFDFDFVAAPRDAREKYGNPYIYFDDVLAYFKNRNIKICGIVNSDIHLTDKNFRQVVESTSAGGLIYGARLDVPALGVEAGEVYEDGFDYFFFDRSVLSYYPTQEFCLGLPWWDYWAVLVPLMHKLPVKRITATPVAHVRHKANWNTEIWMNLGAALTANFTPPYEIAEAILPHYAKDTLTILKTLSNSIDTTLAKYIGG